MNELRSAGSLALASRLRRLSDRLFHEIDQVYAERGLRIQSRWSPVLKSLALEPGQTVTELAQRTGFTHPAIVQVCKALEAEGWIERVDDPADGRRKRIALSARGQRSVAALGPLWASIRRTLDDWLEASGTGFLAGLDRLEQRLTEESLAKAIAARQPAAALADVDVIPFDARYARDFHDLNIEWLERYFSVEAIDRTVLSDPQTHIIEPGGAVLLARAGERIVGCCALKAGDGRGEYELTKMAVAPDCQGMGVGRRLMAAVIDRFRAMRGQLLYLETNSILVPAIRLYEQFGFQHQSGRRPGSPYARSDVYMIWDPRRPGS